MSPSSPQRRSPSPPSSKSSSPPPSTNRPKLSSVIATPVNVDNHRDRDRDRSRDRDWDRDRSRDRVRQRDRDWNRDRERSRRQREGEKREYRAFGSSVRGRGSKRYSKEDVDELEDELDTEEGNRAEESKVQCP